MLDLAPESRSETAAVELDREEVIRALETRERFLTAVLGSLESFFTIDGQWRCTFANEAGVELAGVSAEELLGRDVREFLRDDVREEVCAQLEVAMNARTAVTFRATDSRHDPRILSATAYPLADGGLAIYVRDVTRVESAEAASVDAERRYRELVESVNSAILRWTGDGKLTFFNPTAERLFGWRADEVIGHHVNFLLPGAEPEGEDLSHLARDIVAHPERYATQVNENVRKDGSRLWMAWTNRALLDERGEVTEVLAVASDITELAAAQAALIESEERFRSLADHSPVLIYVHDAEGGLEFVNRTYREFFGVSEELVSGGGWQPLVHPDDSERYVREFLAATRERRFFACEARVRHASGEWRWIDSRAIPRYSARGEFLGMVGSAPDITERKLAEEAVRESERRLRIAQEAAALGVYDWDVPSGRLEWDERVREIWGVRADEQVTFDTFLGGLHPDDLDATQAVIDAELKEGSGQHFTATYRVVNRVDETLRWVAATGNVLFSAGRPVRIIGTVEDVTERRRMEQALREKEEERIAQEERSRLARDLHDSVTQALFAATMKAEALTLTSDTLSAATLLIAEDVRRLSRGALAQMRTLLLELRGDPLEEVPLQQLLRHLVEAAEARSSANVLLTIRGDEPLPPELHIAVYRIAQEALNNVTRHAKASKAWVDLDLQDSVHLLVGDDGCGFDPSTVGAAHLGLKSMRERASEVGAELEVLSKPGDGTVVTLDRTA